MDISILPFSVQVAVGIRTAELVQADIIVHHALVLKF